QDAQHVIGRQRKGVGGVKDLTQRVQRARSDVAVNDAERRQGEQEKVTAFRVARMRGAVWEGGSGFGRRFRNAFRLALRTTARRGRRLAFHIARVYRDAVPEGGGRHRFTGSAPAGS